MAWGVVLSIESAADEIIRKFPREVASYRSGHSASIHMLIGQVKRRSHGGDTATILKVLQERLGGTTTVAPTDAD